MKTLLGAAALRCARILDIKPDVGPVTTREADVNSPNLKNKSEILENLQTVWKVSFVMEVDQHLHAVCTLW